MYQKITTKLGRRKGYVQKIWLVMKLTTVILIATLMQVSATGLAQKINLSKRNAPLEQVITELRKQSGYDFVVSGTVLSKARPVTVSLKNEDFERSLDLIFDSQPIMYIIDGTTVSLKVKEESFIDRIIDRFQAIDARGTVVDEQGKPVPGATIRVKDGKGVSITDEKGNFTLKSVDEGATIVITFIGYDAKEVKAATEMGAIKLSLASSKLDEVQVQAYGITSKRLSTGNISSITAEQIANKPITNPLLALQGEVPGISIAQVTGYANSGIQIQLQGLNSLTQGNDPFFVIDGMPYLSQLPSNFNVTGGVTKPIEGSRRDGTIGSQNGNPLSFINPYDIESISVLKGADATAIYGTRAANGAILITTKKGKTGEAKVTINMQHGFSSYGKPIKMMNKDQYLQMRKDAYFGTDGLTTASPQYATQYDINGTWNQDRSTDWQKELIVTPAYTDVNASLSGGSSLDQYLLSATYHKQQSVVPLDELNDQKASFHLNLNHSSLNQKFKVQISANYQADVNHPSSRDVGTSSLAFSPVAPSVYNSDGTFNWEKNVNGISTWINPLAQISGEPISSKTNNLISNLSVSYEVLPALKVGSTFSYNNLRIDETSSALIRSHVPEERLTMIGSTGFNYSNLNSWNIEPQLRYNKVIFGGNIEGLIGTTLQAQNLNQYYFSGTFDNDILFQNLGSFLDIYDRRTTAYQYRYNSTFGRFSYNFQDRFILNSAFRRDGSSRFGSNNRHHSFWSIAGAWIFSQEKFFSEHNTWLSFGKVRASYGSTGSDNIGNYLYLNQYDLYSYPNNYQGITTSAPAGYIGPPNPNLQWEETRKLEVALDLGFLKDRIVVGGNYYRNRSSNQLTTVSLPLLSGFQSYTTNLDALIQNRGFEVTLSTQNIKHKNFSWLTRINFTTVKNTLLEFPEIEKSVYANLLVVGQSIGFDKFYNYAGVNSQTGLYQFVKADGTLTSAPRNATDRTIYKDFITPFYGGVSNSFHYKSFQLDILINFAKKTARNYRFGDLPGYFTTQSGNQPAFMADYWKNPGDEKDFQKVSSTYSGRGILTAYNAAKASSASVEDASFARLKNVSISYTLPSHFLNTVKLKNARIYFNAQNLLTVSKYTGPDPESGYRSTLGALKTFVLGMQADF